MVGHWDSSTSSRSQHGRCALQAGRTYFSLKLVRTSTSRSASALAVAHFNQVAIEVCAILQHTTARPACIDRDLGGPDTHARLKK